MGLVVKDVGHRESVVLLAEVAQRGGGDLGHVQSAGLDLGDHVSLAAQRAVGDDLDVDAATGLALDLLGKAGELDVDGMVLGQIVAQLQVEGLRAAGSVTACGILGAAACAQQRGRTHDCQDLTELLASDLFHNYSPLLFSSHRSISHSQPAVWNVFSPRCGGSGL